MADNLLMLDGMALCSTRQFGACYCFK